MKTDGIKWDEKIGNIEALRSVGEVEEYQLVRFWKIKFIETQWHCLQER